VLVLSSATNRYLGDLSGLVALLGALGAFVVVEALRGRPLARRLTVAAALLLALATAGMGFALGLKGQYAYFETNNRQLYDKLVHRFSLCHGEIPPEPK
jgi:hypothetical protein